MTFFRSDRGSVLVESAFILPVFVLLIFAGIDMARLIDLTSRVNQTAALISDILSREPTVSETDLSDSLKLAFQIVNPKGSENFLSLKISAISSQSTKGIGIIWSRLFKDEAEFCAMVAPELGVSLSEAQESVKIGYFVVVDLCVRPAETFILSRLVLVKELRLRSRSISIASHPSIRSLD